MMPYLLDANTCIVYLRYPDSIVARKLASVRQDQVVLCDVVKAELYYGAYRSARPEENIRQIEFFFSAFASLPFDHIAADICGRIRAQLAAVGTPIGPYDLQIAAIALANNLTLVTHNTREFRRIVGLLIEDWEAE